VEETQRAAENNKKSGNDHFEKVVTALFVSGVRVWSVSSGSFVTRERRSLVATLALRSSG
jgi:hypothetical protein